MTKIITGFPCIGKKSFYKKSKSLGLEVLDFDITSTYFPGNYMNFNIKDLVGKYDYILLPSHAIVRDHLVNDSLDYTLVYPDRLLKEDYIERFKLRGSPDSFINLLDNNWDKWISNLEHQKNCTHKKLYHGQYLTDIISEI